MLSGREPKSVTVDKVSRSTLQNVTFVVLLQCQINVNLVFHISKDGSEIDWINMSYLVEWVLILNVTIIPPL